MTVHSLYRHLAEELSDEAGVAIALSIFNKATVEDISHLLEYCCQQTFQQAIVECSLVYFSVGATFVVRVYTAAYGVRCMHAIAPGTLHALEETSKGPRPSDPPHYTNAKHQLHQFASEFLSGYSGGQFY